MSAEVVDNFSNRVTDTLHALAVECAAFRIGLSKPQAPHENLVVIFGKRAFLEKFLSLLSRLDRISGEHTLIDYLLRAQGRLIAEQNVEKVQMIDMPAEHHQTDGQGSRQNQPDWAP